MSPDLALALLEQGHVAVALLHTVVALLALHLAALVALLWAAWRRR